MRSHTLFVDALMPDLTILLDCPVELGLTRSREAQSRDGQCRSTKAVLKSLIIVFHERVRQGYLEQAGMNPNVSKLYTLMIHPMKFNSRITSAVQQRLTGAGYAV